MAIELPPLPYAEDALEPHISRETLQYHYGKHHNAYVVKLNRLLEDTPDGDRTLEAIIKSSSGGVLNNAAQVWNHTFYWNCLSANGGGEPSGALADAISRNFGSFAEFKTQFTDSAVSNFGSGWTWLVQSDEAKIAIVNTSNAGTPLTDAGVKPLLTVDVWEHAYYIDYRNDRSKYMKAFWALVNWDFVSANLGI